MRAQTFSTSTCKCCQYYKPEGRRGGTCQQLGVPVRGCWKTCSLGAPAFNPDGNRLEEELALLEHTLSLNCTSSHPVAETHAAAQTAKPLEAA